MGVSTYDQTGQDVAFIANHDAYGEQAVTLELTRPMKAKLFNRETGRYDVLESKSGSVSFKLPPAGGAIVLFEP